MCSDKDFQTFWFRYKTEGEPHGISINSFCINHGVPYKQFYAWFKKHAKDTVIPVEIEGAPTDEETDDVEVPPQPASKPKAKKLKGGILITIQTRMVCLSRRVGLTMGYICYMYLDDDLIDIEHLCCLAHVRAKLERAERMGCKEASSPMSLVRKLYKREDLYVEKGYDAEKIKEMRNDEYTRGIVDKLQNEMFDLMANKMDELPKLMQQALNYLHKFWKQVFAYRNDGEYFIDNLAAERAIRPQTIQCKSSLFFGSVQAALRSAMYNTFIQTCKQVGVSFRQ